MTDQTAPEPTLAELELREQLYAAMDGNLRMSRRRELLAAYRDQILATASSAGQAPATDRAALRDRIAAALLARIKQAVVEPPQPPWGQTTSLLAANEFDLADAVLSVLPATTDRAAALNLAADFFRGLHSTGTTITAQEAEQELRRMADETQQPEGERRCRLCEQPITGRGVTHFGAPDGPHYHVDRAACRAAGGLPPAAAQQPKEA